MWIWAQKERQLSDHEGSVTIEGMDWGDGGLLIPGRTCVQAGSQPVRDTVHGSPAHRGSWSGWPLSLAFSNFVHRELGIAFLPFETRKSFSCPLGWRRSPQ